MKRPEDEKRTPAGYQPEQDIGGPDETDLPSTEAEIEPGANHAPSQAETFSSEPAEEATGEGQGQAEQAPD